MTIHLAGLSDGDIRAYYSGAVLHCKEGLFKVQEGTKKSLQGHIIRNRTWTPYTCKPTEASVVYPKEGYVLLNGNVHRLTQQIRRTRRKGITSDTYTLQPMAGSVPPESVSSLVSLAVMFDESVVTDYNAAVTALKRKECKGYVFSKDLCICKRSNIREVWLRGVHLGNIKRNGLELPKRYKVFQQELEEYNIPCTMV